MAQRQQRRSTQRNEPSDQDALLFMGFMLAVLFGIAFWILYSRYHLSPKQLVIASIAPLLGLALLFETIRFFGSLQQKRLTLWPKPSPIVPITKERHQLPAIDEKKVLLGHNTAGKPLYWTQDSRTMQGIAFGMSGAGKTTLLESVTQQDIAAGGPIIFIDGKGDLGLFHNLIPAVAAAGRSHQLRLIDPAHPHQSTGYNPFYTPNGNPDEHVGFIFESFRMDSHNFFDEHQRVYLENIARILSYSGKLYNFYDVLVCAYSEPVLRNQITVARAAIENSRTVTPQQRRTLEMSIHNIMETFADQDRVSKIQGLLNNLMTFMGDELAIITGPYDRLLTLDEVIDNNLILYVSLNVNVNARAVTALGRILLQNLQLVIGRRYANSQVGTKFPFVSVVMDEFAPFAYENFARIIQTARGANVAFLFSLQSAPQLLQVGHGFRNDLSSAPNSTFMLRIRDEETAQLFLKASAHVKTLKQSIKVRKKGMFSTKFEEEDGTGTQSESLETTAKDEHLKKMPTGQMEVLMSDAVKGLVHEHVHIRRAIRHYIPELPTPIFEPYAVPRARSQGLHLRFPDVQMESQWQSALRTKRGVKRS